MRDIFLFGASGHAKVVLDIVERQGLFRVAGVIDDNPAFKDTIFRGYPVMGTRSEISLLGEVASGVIAVGANRPRRNIAEWLVSRGYGFISAVHPDAVIDSRATIRDGTVVMAGVVINTDTLIGRHCIINTGATVDHDCLVGDYVHVAPGATVCGGVSIGPGTLIGAGATVLPNISIGADVTVGAGTTVTRDIGDESLVVGPR